jgi:hypothetical protein
MSNKRKTRIPGRYERPAALRPQLGDKLGEAGVRDGFVSALRINAAGRRRALATVEADTDPDRDLEEARKKSGTSEAFAEADAGTIHEAKAGGPGGVYVLDVIKSGWNKARSRHYPPEVLERDVPKVYPKGTQMFIDHPTTDEADRRPERSLGTLAAVFLEDPWTVREDDGSITMRTTARVFSPWQPLIAEAWPHIGVSINGHGKGDYGEREGHTGLLMEELTYGQSVDFVTRPGAGGRVVGLLESAAATARSVGGRAALLREAGSLGAFAESRIHLGFTQLADDMYGEGRLSRDERITMSGAIGDALAAFVARLDSDAPQLYQRSRWAGPDGKPTAEAAQVATRETTAQQTQQAISRALSDQYATQPAQPDQPAHYCWYRDHDPDRGLVWFDAAGPDNGHGTWQQSYTTLPGGEVELLGTRIEVVPDVVYRPVTPTRSEPGDSAYEESHRITETTAGDPPAGSETGPAPATSKESDMGEQSPEVVAREAAEARAIEITKERDEARTELARFRAGETARPILDRLLTESTLPAAAYDRVRADFTPAALPLTESGALDEEKLRTLAVAAITAEAAYVARLEEDKGAGRVTGMGAAPARPGSALPAAFGATREAASAVPDQATQEALAAIYARRGLTADAAKLAVTGPGR